MKNLTGLFRVALLASLALYGPSTARVSAHTLPISYLTIVPGEEHLHLELTLNPFELNFFGELDRDRNGRLDPTELAAQESAATRLLLDHLKLSVNGKNISADVAGLTQDPESHHITLRAHYPVDARQLPVTIESTLHAITSGSHITQVTFGHGERRKAARLDMSTNRATFEPLGVVQAQNRSTQDISPIVATALWIVFILPGLVVVSGLLWCMHREFFPRRIA